MLGLLLTAWVIACGSADIGAPAQNCGTEALNGSYGTQRNGQAAPGSTWTSVGLATFDGHGKIFVQQTVSINGTASPVPRQLGSYTINADCTGSEAMRAAS